MIDFDYFYKEIEKTNLRPWLETLPGQVENALQNSNDGNLPRWLKLYDELPDIQTTGFNLTSEAIQILGESFTPAAKEKFEATLRGFHPWRKGPWTLFDTHIDTEWLCWKKWSRLKDSITPLKNRKVLDVGSGNGYYAYRMAGEGAKLVAGVDPTLLYMIQFFVFQKYIQDPRVCILPIGIDDMPDNLGGFDTVFSMGLLYHRRAPFDHLLQLKSFLREGGELVLETLVIDGKQGEALCPAGRYAMMPNVWFIPSTLTLESWLKRMQFKEIKLLDITPTKPDEQRVTDWMDFHSLQNFLDPKNPELTVEGYPAPKRAILTAKKPTL